MTISVPSLHLAAPVRFFHFVPVLSSPLALRLHPAADKFVKLRRTIKAVYKNPRTGFAAQTLQQAQARNSSISREEVKAFLDEPESAERLQQLRASVRSAK